MTDHNVHLLRATQVDNSENEAKPDANHHSSDLFVKRSPVNLAPFNHHQADNISERSSVREEAWQDEKAIITLARSFNSINLNRDLLSEVPLSAHEKLFSKTRKMRIWTVLFHFFLNTSFHGLPHVASSRRSWFRITYWILVLHLSFFIMVAAIYFVTAQYVEMKTVLYSKQTTHRSLPFPAITICNLNMFRRSVAESTNLDLIDLAIVFNDLSDDPWLNETIDDYFKEHSDVFGIRNSSFFYNNSGHQLKDMLFNCRLANRTCGLANFTQRSSINGNCYTFNSGENGPILHARHGRRQGLQLVLNAEEYEYFLVESDAIGFNVFIHHPDHFPYFDAVGSFTIPSGQLTRVALNKIDYKLLTTSQGGQCENYVDLKYFKSYGVESCLAECAVDFIASRCGCKPEYLPGPAEVCLAIDKCQYDNLIAFYEEQAEQCDCPPACEYSRYTKTLSYANFPASHFVSILNISSSALKNSPSPDFVVNSENGTNFYLNENFTESFLSKNFVQVQIYYDTLTTTTMEEGLEYSTAQFLIDFGGYIGLFTGAGFLTLFELLDLCFNFVRPYEE